MLLLSACCVLGFKIGALDMFFYPKFNSHDNSVNWFLLLLLQKKQG